MKIDNMTYLNSEKCYAKNQQIKGSRRTKIKPEVGEKQNRGVYLTDGKNSQILIYCN